MKNMKNMKNMKKITITLWAPKNEYGYCYEQELTLENKGENREKE